MPTQWKDLRARIAELELRLARAEQERLEALTAAEAHMRVSLSAKRLCAAVLAWKGMKQCSVSYQVPPEVAEAVNEHEDSWLGDAR